MNVPLIIFSSQDFDDLPTRKHRIAKKFASQGSKVIYIEAPFTHLSAIKDPTYRPKVERKKPDKGSFAKPLGGKPSTDDALLRKVWLCTEFSLQDTCRLR